MAKKHLIDFLPGFNRYGSEKRVKGPCPWCGGEDRFVVFADQGREETGTYHCFDNPGRGCGRNGDVITFLREKKDYTWEEACKEVGLEELLDEYGSGKSDEQKAVETEAEAPEAALSMKALLLEAEAEVARRNEAARRRKKRRRRAKKNERRHIESVLDEHHSWLLHEARLYRRLRRACRAVSRFVTLHYHHPGGPTGEGPTEEGSPPEAFHRSPGPLPPPEDSGAEEESSGYAGSLGGQSAHPLFLIHSRTRFEHVEELWGALAMGLEESLKKAREADRAEADRRVEKFFDLVTDDVVAQVRGPGG